MKTKLMILHLCLIIFSLPAEIKFNPLALNDKNEFLFHSIEVIGRNKPLKTLYYGYLNQSNAQFETISFYPEKLIHLKYLDKIYIQNRSGLYCYDLKKNEVQEIKLFPGLTSQHEYSISQILKAAVSPDNHYILGKIPTSPSKAKLILYDLYKNKELEIARNVEILPGSPTAAWSPDSNYFIYQKNDQIYYFSISDFLSDKQLSEEWRIIGRVHLKNTYWTNDNYLIWIEKNLIYKADPNQFYYRSIYKNYLRQGEIIGKIPFQFDPAFDRFIYNSKTGHFTIVKDGASIYYYSLTEKSTQNPYIQLNDNMRFEDCHLFNNGEGIVSVNILSRGKINKKIFLLKKVNQSYMFKPFSFLENEDIKIHSYSISQNNRQFVINSGQGAYCYDFQSEKILWKYNKEAVIQSVNIGLDQWVIGGALTTVRFSAPDRITPLFASSLSDAGFYQEKIAVSLAGASYFIDRNSKMLTPLTLKSGQLEKDPKNNYYRLLSRQIKKGFYQESIFLKELYTGKHLPVTGTPKLYYQLYQPEIKLASSYYLNPLPEKYEVALIFDCIKTAEGIFPILQALDQFKIQASFFINGIFMDINPKVTQEIANFDFEIGNMFQYYVNLTQTHFLIDKNFIRQGLSSNEEKFFHLTGKNFAPYWHAPMYAANTAIMNFGLQSGYQYVSYHLDSFDWIGKNDKDLFDSYYMDNPQLIKRILKQLKPGQIILLNTGKNYIQRDDWFFNDLDILITELVRSGYSFTIVSDLQRKYREID